MNAEQVKNMMLEVSRNLILQKEELCRLDGFIGDGDHGLTVERGFKAVERALKEGEFCTPREVLEVTGQTLADAMGGAIGLIVGNLFLGGVEQQEDSDDFGTEEFGRLLQEGLLKIQEVGEAKEGDRTLVDALAPGVNAYMRSKESGGDLGVCMHHAAEASAAGAENTKNMIARKGRARFLREKSLGYVDAGATTMKIIIASMSGYIDNNCQGN